MLKTSSAIFVERQGNRIELNEGDGIYELDVIITDAGTTSDILFRDGTKSRLSPNTELKLDDFEFGVGEDTSFIMNLTRGAMRAITGELVKLDPEAFETITPRATTGKRGTEFFIPVTATQEYFNH